MEKRAISFEELKWIREATKHICRTFGIKKNSGVIHDIIYRHYFESLRLPKLKEDGNEN